MTESQHTLAHLLCAPGFVCQDGLTIHDLSVATDPQLSDELEIQSGQHSHKLTLAQILHKLRPSAISADQIDALF